MNMPYPASIMAFGVGFGDGLQYFANATTILPSAQQPFLLVTLDIRVTADGSTVLVAAQGAVGVTQVLRSVKGGKNFSTININSNMPSDLSSPRYCSIANQTSLVSHATRLWRCWWRWVVFGGFFRILIAAPRALRFRETLAEKGAKITPCLTTLLH